MAKYLLEASYTSEGAKGLMREGGAGRRAAIDAMAKKLGGRLEAFYFAFGDVDAIAILDLPDNISASAASLTASQTGAVHIKTTVLMTAEELDQAAKKTVEYRAPGK